MTMVSERSQASTDVPTEVPPPVAPPPLVAQKPVEPAARRSPKTLDPRWQVASYALSLLSCILFVLLVQLTLVSQLQHFAAQKSLYQELRLHLAEGSVPIGQQDINGALVAPGTPLALLEIPEIGVREVVVEGTSSSETQRGVGHKRDTPLPGQPGGSVLMGRATAYGGVFGELDELKAGDTFTVTTGQGVSTFQVIGQSTGDIRLPQMAPGGGRLTLITAAGRPFMPTGVRRLYASLATPAFTAPPAALTKGNIDPDEQALSPDASVLFALSWLLEALIGLSVAAVWAWKRWGHKGTWIACAPLLAAAAFASADKICALLPNVI
jgi:LPXTG-site transpeptidase (sortase) family protein